MMSTTPSEFGDVVLVPFPFTDQSASKRRPAIVVSGAAYNQRRPDVIVLAITSQARPSPSIGEVAVLDWLAAGLLKPSVFKPLLLTIQRGLVLRRLGRLSETDRRAVRLILDQILGP